MTNVEALRESLAQFSGVKGPVLLALQHVQDELGYVPDEALDVVASVCNVSRAEVYGVFTFYEDFRSVAPEQVVVKVCVAEACQSRGSRAVVDQLHQAGYDVHAGGRKDGIQVEQTFCLGNCALGPAALVNGQPIGRASAESILESAKAAK